MNRYRLESRVRNVGIAYLLLFFAGAHYAYLNKWGTQVLFWITFGGIGIWWLIDIFRLSGLVQDHNDPIFDEMEWLDQRQAEDRDDFGELKRMKAQRSGNLLEDDWHDRQSRI